MAATLADLYLKCWKDPAWEAEHVSKRLLRGVQAEIISRAERFIRQHNGGVMPILSSRQTGKNEIEAVLERRHLHMNQLSPTVKIWVRTAPTHKPQIVNSKKRLEEVLRLDDKMRIKHPLFNNQKLVRKEGYIWSLGNAIVEFMSSGQNANVVGATASECLSMDEAHKVNKDKFDEDFAPFTASTNAATLLWGVAADGLDTIEWYRQSNIEEGRPELNLYYPCEVWMDLLPSYRFHVEDRIRKLGYDHPIIKTQYRLKPVEAMGKFLQPNHIRALFSGDHDRHLTPRPGCHYEALVDIAAGNEDFNPNNVIEGNEDTDTDSSIMWIYEVSSLVCSNGIFPIIRIVNLTWITGARLEKTEEEIKANMQFWNIQKVTIDAIGVGRQIAESIEALYGEHMVNKYTASDTSVSEDCFDLQARLNYQSVLMFRDDGSPEYAEFQRQCGWTRYASSKGKMKLEKASSDKHIDMVKGLTYLNQNKPAAGMHEIYAVEGNYDADT